MKVYLMKAKTIESFTDMEKAVNAIYRKDGSISFTIPGICMDYIDRFLKWKCSRELLTLNIYNAREITESIAMRQAAIKVKRGLGIDTKNTKVLVLVVGDGATPRTGAIIAYTTSWKVRTIDPILRDSWKSNIEYKEDYINNNIRRLACFKDTIENWCTINKIKEEMEHIIIMAPHTHCSLLPAVDWAFKNKSKYMVKNIHLIANPCCYELMLPVEKYGSPNKTYDDWRIVSGHRRIQVYKNIKKEEKYELYS